MNIYHSLEVLHLDQTQTTPAELYQVVANYDVEKWVKATDFFLRSIEREHHIPGKIIETLRGICQCHRDGFELTQRQLYFLVHNLIAYWDQLTCESRSALDL